MLYDYLCANGDIPHIVSHRAFTASNKDTHGHLA